MPQAINIVLKNGSAVDKTFELLSPSAGYGAGPADWALREGVISSTFPILRASATSSATAKKVHWTLRVPSSYTDTVTGLTRVGSAFNAEVFVTVPNDLPETLKADCIAFLTNLCANSLFRASAKDGLPTT